MYLWLIVAGIYPGPQRCGHPTAAAAALPAAGKQAAQSGAASPRAQEDIHCHHGIYKQHQRCHLAARLGDAPLQGQRTASALCEVSSVSQAKEES